MLTGDVRQKCMKLPAATARSAAFKGFEPAYTDFLQLNSKLNPSVGLFRPSLSGSKAAELKHFREALRRALNDLTANSDIAGWKIATANDLVSITRGRAITDSQRRHLAKPKARRCKDTALERR